MRAGECQQQRVLESMVIGIHQTRGIYPEDPSTEVTYHVPHSANLDTRKSRIDVKKTDLVANPFFDGNGPD
jgi:hypothetical protein